MNSAEVMAVLRTIDDPEMPISIVDLGVVAGVQLDAAGESVRVAITPTFVGCPALDVLRNEIERKLLIAGMRQAHVDFVHDPPWSSDRISQDGRAALRRHGVSTPDVGAALVQLTVRGLESVPCPYCNSTKTHMESPFGPTRCRMIYYCSACRNSFERMKPI